MRSIRNKVQQFGSNEGAAWLDRTTTTSTHASFASSSGERPTSDRVESKVVSAKDWASGYKDRKSPGSGAGADANVRLLRPKQKPSPKVVSPSLIEALRQRMWEAWQSWNTVQKPSHAKPASMHANTSTSTQDPAHVSSQIWLGHVYRGTIIGKIHHAFDSHALSSPAAAPLPLPSIPPEDPHANPPEKMEKNVCAHSSDPLGAGGRSVQGGVLHGGAWPSVAPSSWDEALSRLPPAPPSLSSSSSELNTVAMATQRVRDGLPPSASSSSAAQQHSAAAYRSKKLLQQQQHQHQHSSHIDHSINPYTTGGTKVLDDFVGKANTQNELSEPEGATAGADASSGAGVGAGGVSNATDERENQLRILEAFMKGGMSASRGGGRMNNLPSGSKSTATSSASGEHVLDIRSQPMPQHRLEPESLNPHGLLEFSDVECVATRSKPRRPDRDRASMAAKQTVPLSRSAGLLSGIGAAARLKRLQSAALGLQSKDFETDLIHRVPPSATLALVQPAVQPAAVQPAVSPAAVQPSPVAPVAFEPLIEASKAVGAEQAVAVSATTLHPEPAEASTFVPTEPSSTAAPATEEAAQQLPDSYLTSVAAVQQDLRARLQDPLLGPAATTPSAAASTPVISTTEEAAQQLPDSYTTSVAAVQQDLRARLQDPLLGPAATTPSAATSTPVVSTAPAASTAATTSTPSVASSNMMEAMARFRKALQAHPPVSTKPSPLPQQQMMVQEEVEQAKRQARNIAVQQQQRQEQEKAAAAQVAAQAAVDMELNLAELMDTLGDGPRDSSAAAGKGSHMQAASGSRGTAADQAASQTATASPMSVRQGPTEWLDDAAVSLGDSAWFSTTPITVTPRRPVVDWVAELEEKARAASEAALNQEFSSERGAATHHPAMASREVLSEEGEAAQQLPSSTLSGPPREILIPEDSSVKQLALLLQVSTDMLERFILEQLNEKVHSHEDLVPPETAELAALEFGHVGIRVAAQHIQILPRPAIVTIMGHVDHGKTSLLDAMRNTNVVASEAGGITQHIGAFEVDLPGSDRKLTFLDTPGHAAFSSMRARGAAVTDIVVLAVSADDSVMPQTREALAHARAAGCPVVIALTKVDLPSANPGRVKQALLAEGVELEEFGGAVQLVETSVVTKYGLTDLQEAITLQAELMELRAPAAGHASATVVEAKLDRRTGALATIVVKRGTLRAGDAVVVGTEWGKVRALRTSSNEVIQEAGPGQHAQISGLRGLPLAGDELTVVTSDERARSISAARAVRSEGFRLSQMAAALHAQRQKERDAYHSSAAHRLALRREVKAIHSLGKGGTGEERAEMSSTIRKIREELRSYGAKPIVDAPGTTSLEGGDDADDSTTAVPSDSNAPKEELLLLVKADVQGSVEAVNTMVEALSTDHVSVRVLYSGVGPVTESDANLAIASGACLVVFNQQGFASREAEAAIKNSLVRVVSHNIIYHLMDLIKDLVVGAAPMLSVEEVVGSATVLTTFPLSASNKGKGKVAGGLIAGARVAAGGRLSKEAAFFRVMRDGVEVWQGPCSSLRRFKDEVESVSSNTECGVVLAGGKFSDFKNGDVIECVRLVSKKAGSE